MLLSMACLLHIYSTCARVIQHSKKVCKVERLIGTILERKASFLSFSGNLKKWRQHGKMDTTLDENILWR